MAHILPLIRPTGNASLMHVCCVSVIKESWIFIGKNLSVKTAILESSSEQIAGWLRGLLSLAEFAETCFCRYEWLI